MAMRLPVTLPSCIRNHPAWLAVLGLCVLLLGGGALVSAILKDVDGERNEKCIRCHVETFNRSISAASKHAPVFERQCIACHLLPGSAWGGSNVLRGFGAATLTPVSQAPKWRKRSIFRETGSTLDHAVALTGLSLQETYRFRISPNEIIQTSGGDIRPASRWLALNPGDISETRPFSVQTDVTFASAGAEMPPDIPYDRQLRALTLTRSGKETILVSWRSLVEYPGLIELEKDEGIDLAAAGPAGAETGGATPDSGLSSGGAAAEHPPLRTPEELTIDGCYECHPQSRLGTSHPVRLYSRGGETEIPADLPTINDGMLTCVTCHDPHGGSGKFLVREKIKTKLCVACHTMYKNTSPSTTFPPE